MKFLLGTIAYNQHIQNVALALHEAGVLGAYYTGGVDNYRHSWLRMLRHIIKKSLPSVNHQLSRRKITAIPGELVFSDWAWEGLRIIASKLKMGAMVEDWFWEKSEHHLDRRCSHLIRQPQYDVFCGVEHGALFSIKTAKELGKKSIVDFLSPHHTTRKKWVDSEYEKFPELLTPSTKRLIELARFRDARRDEEASLADIICANSSFTSQSLIRAGISKEKIITVPLGGPPAISNTSLPNSHQTPMQFIYAGPVSVRKGGHYLIEAWKLLSINQSAELHLYGIPLLPKRCFAGLGENVFSHGSVSQLELFEAYQKGSVLVFPTLCDGFGMVVLEAMAHGLPVITTQNAGASDFIEEGKNGFLVPPRDAEALAERLEWCIRHPKELLEMRRYALATAKGWTWTDFRVSLVQQLERVLNLSFDLVV